MSIPGLVILRAGGARTGRKALTDRGLVLWGILLGTAGLLTVLRAPPAVGHHEGERPATVDEREGA